MKVNGKLSFFVKAAIAAVIVFSVVTIIKLQIDYNNLRETSEDLLAQIEEYRDRIEELSNELDAPFDHEYIERMAREKLGYCLPDEIIFYSDR